jgi:hypothetical protein
MILEQEIVREAGPYSEKNFGPEENLRGASKRSIEMAAALVPAAQKGTCPVI